MHRPSDSQVVRDNSNVRTNREVPEIFDVTEFEEFEPNHNHVADAEVPEMSDVTEFEEFEPDHDEREARGERVAYDLSEHRRAYRPLPEPEHEPLNLKIPLVILVLCLAWVGWKVQQGFAQHRAVQQIRALGGSVVYDYSYSEDSGTFMPGMGRNTPAWLRRQFGDDLFHDVVAVALTGPAVNNDTLKLLKNLKEIRTLYLMNTNVTDVGLTHLEHLSHLRELDLSLSKVSDTGLAHLSRHSHLTTLRLFLTRVGDQGLAHLKQLGELRQLYLYGTKVSHEGISDLKRFQPELTVSW
jgi:hypothetical protein